MPSTAQSNARSVVHQTSGDRHLVLPDVCATPPDDVPLPYPNVADAVNIVDGPKTVAIDGCTMLVQDAAILPTSGDEAGVGGGVISGTTMAEATPALCSFDIKIEGRGVCRTGDPLFHNRKNAAG